MNPSIARSGQVLRAAIVVALITMSAAPARWSRAALPNVLLILSDDHSAAHVACYGNKDVYTPNLDRLAAEGMRFDRAYVTCPQCVPSRASILTGRHPIDIGMTRFTAGLPRDVVMFPELLKQQRGYFAGLCGRGYHLEGRVLDHPAVRPYLTEQDIPNVAERLDYVKVAGGGGGETVARHALEQFQEFLDEIPADRPFFLQLCWSDPHRPFSKGDLAHKHDPKSLTLPPFYPDSPAIRADLASFYDEVSRMDASVGKALQILDERKLAENTIVILMGDNGSSQFRGKGTLNETGIHVPLIVRWPGVVQPGSTSGALISGDDLAPTILELAGVERPANLTGISFLPLLRDPKSEPQRQQVICERGPHGSALPRNSAAFDLGRSIVMDRYKLIYNVTWQLPYQPVDFNLDEVRRLNDEDNLDPSLADLLLAEHRPMFELYDLQQDPWEMKNLIDSPDVAQVEEELKGRLTAWMIQHRDFVPLPLGAREPASRPARR